MCSLQRLLFRLARSSSLSSFLRWTIAHMSFALPGKKLRETGTLIAFHHPQPAYRVHILLLPKRDLSGLEQLSPEDSDFLIDLFATVQSLVTEFDLDQTGYRLIANGGRYQDFPHLHFHLVSEG